MKKKHAKSFGMFFDLITVKGEIVIISKKKIVTSHVCFCVNVTSWSSHPVLVVLLCRAAAPATRLILRLLTPCKKRETAAAIRGQRRR